jgi:hypothetical protein
MRGVVRGESLESNSIRSELNKLKFLPAWGRPQDDRWDRLSNFVYVEKTLRGVLGRTEVVARAEGLDVKRFKRYALRRWYNHHTHDQILQMFYAHPTVRPEPDSKHHSIDFYVRGIPFDLKISRFPQAYPESLEYAWQHRQHLASWQYENQSKQGRYHTGNRLFIILHHRAEPELTWQLRRDFETLARQVEGFLSAPVLLGLTVTNHHTQETFQPWAAVIFYVKST